MKVTGWSWNLPKLSAGKVAVSFWEVATWKEPTTNLELPISLYVFGLLQEAVVPAVNAGHAGT